MSDIFSSYKVKEKTSWHNSGLGYSEMCAKIETMVAKFGAHFEYPIDFETEQRLYEAAHLAVNGFDDPLGTRPKGWYALLKWEKNQRIEYDSNWRSDWRKVLKEAE